MDKFIPNARLVSVSAVLSLLVVLAGCASPGESAASHKDSAQLQRILDQPNRGNENLNRVLEYSIIYDCPECARIVLRLGAVSTEAQLADAARDRKEKCVEVLLEYGADPDAALAYMRTFPERIFSKADIVRSENLFKKFERDHAPKSAAPEVAAAPAAAAAAFASDVDHPLYSRPSDPEKVAVVVGIEKYGALPEARFARRDAQAMRDHLVAMGYAPRNIMLLQDQDATKGSLLKAINAWIPNHVNERSTVFFYYSGHGAPDVKSNQAYLVPVDGDPEDLEDTALPLKQLYHKLGELKTRHVLVALDSCFSGAGGRSVLPKDARPLVTRIDTGALGSPNVVTLSASKGDQITGAIEEQRHGAFTYFLLKGLNGAAEGKDGRVTAQALYDYLTPQVEDAARLQNRDQDPQLFGSDAASVMMR